LFASLDFGGIMAKIGIIGGSGLDDPDFIKHSARIDVSTKYGKPSSPLTVGLIGKVDVVVLARHGNNHTISPTMINNKANIQALKDQGVTHILATTACGSLREQIGRGDFVILDQFIDFTRHREHPTFFADFSSGATHTAMPEPFDASLRKHLIDSGKSLGFKSHDCGTVITIEGPRFSTKAESKMFRIWGADVINMSIAPECILANEAGIPYAAVAMSTDYDSFRDDVEPASWEEIKKVFGQNAERVKQLLISAVQRIGGDD
jgi:5'-methylthioadenosine phosphorylase